MIDQRVITWLTIYQNKTMATIFPQGESLSSKIRRKKHTFNCIFGDIKHKKFGHFKFDSTEKSYTQKISSKRENIQQMPRIEKVKCTHRGEKGFLPPNRLWMGNLAEQKRRESYIYIDRKKERMNEWRNRDLSLTKIFSFRPINSILFNASHCPESQYSRLNSYRLVTWKKEKGTAWSGPFLIKVENLRTS